MIPDLGVEFTEMSEYSTIILSFREAPISHKFMRIAKHSNYSTSHASSVSFLGTV
jgi:hypothetical protein